jgi:hypothetical protein
MESHRCNGAQKLEITRAVLVHLASDQNMQGTSPDDCAAFELRPISPGALSHDNKGCVPFLEAPQRGEEARRASPQEGMGSCVLNETKTIGG